MALHWKRIGTCFLIARQHCGAYKAYIEASVDFTPVNFANTQHTLLPLILHQWILQIQNRHCFGGFCKYTAHTASLDFAPFFVRAQLRQSHTRHKCISPLFWFGHTWYIGASNITTLVNIVDQTVAAKADMFQEDSYQIEIDSDDHL